MVFFITITLIVTMTSATQEIIEYLCWGSAPEPQIFPVVFFSLIIQ